MKNNEAKNYVEDVLEKQTWLALDWHFHKSAHGWMCGGFIIPTRWTTSEALVVVVSTSWAIISNY